MTLTHDGGRFLHDMYPMACESPCIEVRNMVMETLDWLLDPHSTRIQQGWERNTCWVSGCRYSHINAKKVGNLSLDLRRIRWIEELRLVQLFIFNGVSPTTMVNIAGRVITQNRWVYEEVAKVIPADRIAVSGRRTSSSGTGATYGLPQLPQVYSTLNPLEAHPTYTYLYASEFHGYEPDDEYTPLTDTKYSCT